MILFLCTDGNAHVVVWAYDREQAKRQARQWLDRNPDYYVVSPLTAPGDRVHLDITLST